MLATDWLRFTNQNGIVMSRQLNAAPTPALQISGEVEVVRNAVTNGDPGVFGVSVDSSVNTTPEVSIDHGGLLQVSALLPGGAAFGYIGGGANHLAPLTNLGVIRVMADQLAVGVSDIGLLNNGGEITVTSIAGDAFGVKFGGGILLNSGAITVTGHGQVTGLDLSLGAHFINEGSIVAHDDSAATTSIGVNWVGDFQQPDELFVNQGRIEADTALTVNQTFGEASVNLFTNNGVLAGDVFMGGGGAETLVNNGTVTGAIRFIGADSLYDGRLGFALGPITASNNGGDTFLGGAGSETMVGGFGNDTISSGGGNDSVTAGSGNDSVDGGAGQNYLRGDDGNDVISGGADFDDLNGNMGNDTIHGNGGDDWVVGGRDNDMLFGDAGSDIVWGNLGNDTLDGGDGNDQVRGGQGDDVINGGAGDDFVSGDRGADTITGGAGADIFHGSQDAGIDKVMDFNLAEGDRVMLDPGTHYTISQVGADTVIDMGASPNGAPNQMILVGVQMSTLTGSWIFGA